MQDRFTDFCNDDAVQECLCDIAAHHVDEWFRASRRVALGVDNSWTAQQLLRLEGARVIGMMDLVCSLTDLTPEDIVQLDPEKYRALVLYVANYK